MVAIKIFIGLSIYMVYYTYYISLLCQLRSPGKENISWFLMPFSYKRNQELLGEMNGSRTGARMTQTELRTPCSVRKQGHTKNPTNIIGDTWDYAKGTQEPKLGKSEQQNK